MSKKTTTIATIVIITVFGIGAFLILRGRTNTPKAVSPAAPTVTAPATTPVASETKPTVVAPPPAAVDLSATISYFNRTYGYPLLGRSFCENINAGQYNTDLAELESATGGYLPEQEGLMAYFAKADDACDDSNITQDEYAVIINLHAQVGNHEGNIVKWHLIIPFEKEMNTYLVSILGSGNSVDDCAKINSVTPTAFLNQIHAIESKYSVPVAGDDLKVLLSDKQLSCKNS